MTSSLLIKFNPSYVKCPLLKVKISKTLKKHFFLANLQNIFNLEIIKIFGEPQKFLKGQKSKGWIQRSKYFPQISKLLNVKVFMFCYFFILGWTKVSLALPHFSSSVPDPKCFFLISKSLKSNLKNFKFFLTSFFCFHSHIHSFICSFFCVWGQSGLCCYASCFGIFKTCSN